MKILIVNLRGNEYIGFLACSLMVGFRQLGAKVYVLPSDKIVKDYGYIDIICLCCGLSLHNTKISDIELENLNFIYKFKEKCIIIEEDEFGPDYESDIDYINDQITIFNNKNLFHDFFVETIGKDFFKLDGVPYFKREYSNLIEYPDNCHSLPLCAFIPNMKDFISPYKNREYYINASFTNTNPRRKHIYKAIKQNFKHLKNELSYQWDWSKWGQHKWTQQDYWKQLAKTKITVSPLGNGTQCIRDFEAAAFSLTAIQGKTTVIENMYKDGEECILFNTPDELIDKIGFYLKNEELSERVYLSGLKKTVEFHMPINRAKKILDVLKR